MKYYIAGPMSGIPHFNVPLFDAVAKSLRDNDIDVVSPAELDSPEMREFALASEDGKLPEDGRIAGESWPDVLARDVKLIGNEIDAIIVLPNWHKSRGAKLECFVGLLTGKRFFSQRDGEVFEIGAAHIRQLIKENMP